MFNKFPLIIVDQSTDARILEALKDAGYEIFSIQQTMPGTDDLEPIRKILNASIQSMHKPNAGELHNCPPSSPTESVIDESG